MALLEIGAVPPGTGITGLSWQLAWLPRFFRENGLRREIHPRGTVAKGTPVGVFALVAARQHEDALHLGVFPGSTPLAVDERNDVVRHPPYPNEEAQG